MDRLERIHDLLDELDVLMQAEYPGYTNGHYTVGSDAYRSISVVKIANEPDVPMENRPYRYLYEQSCYRGKWDNPTTEHINEYLKSQGKLLEDDMEIKNKDERNDLKEATNSLLMALQDVMRIREGAEEKENLRMIIRKLLDLGMEIEDAIRKYDWKEAAEDDSRRAMDSGSRE